MECFSSWNRYLKYYIYSHLTNLESSFKAIAHKWAYTRLPMFGLSGDFHRNISRLWGCTRNVERHRFSPGQQGLPTWPIKQGLGTIFSPGVLRYNYIHVYTGADLAFCQGESLTQWQCRASSSSRKAARRFLVLVWTPVLYLLTYGASSTSRVATRLFLLLFRTPVKDVFLASTIMRSIVHEPQSGEAIFFGGGYSEPP